jgi:predicted secreted hydrolase
MEIPKLGLKLQASARLKSQELASKARLAPNYWEGAITVQGTRNGTVIRGVGYLEMTGYDRAVELRRE